MTTSAQPLPPRPQHSGPLHRNIWIVSVTSFLTDVSSEMVINLVPLFLANVLGVRTAVIGLIEGVAETTASLLKVFSGWFSDRMGQRKWLAVLGYGLSTAAKPFYYVASSWGVVAGVRWADRVGKGIRTAPRDALIADSTAAERRGLAFGVQRAADTAGAMLGLLLALLIVWLTQEQGSTLGERTFRVAVLVSLIPAVLAVVVLAWGARDVPIGAQRSLPVVRLRGMGKPFLLFLLIVGVFELGNSSDAFLVLRAQDAGLSVMGVMGVLAAFNFVYALLATPAGAISDRIGRKRVIVVGWLLYALTYAGFALARSALHVTLLYLLYGVYYALSHGTTRALVADLVPANLRGTAYGTYNALIGLLDLPASLIAGLLWQGAGGWQGLGPTAPFWFGAGAAAAATVAFLLWNPRDTTIAPEESKA